MLTAWPLLGTGLHMFTELGAQNAMTNAGQLHFTLLSFETA